jgi:GT2 family glycosyltransferase
MRLGAIVLAYGDDSYRRVVEGLRQAGLQRDQILVVHNPSHPAEASIDDSVESLRMPSNVGYGAAMNAGIRARRAAGDDAVLLLTHDTVIDREAVEALLRAAQAAPRFGALGPAIEFTGATSSGMTYGGYHALNGRVGHLESPSVAAGLPDVGECDWIDGCAMMLRLAALEEAGPFEESFFMYFEDTELCLRLRRAGWHVGVALGARIESQPGKHLRPGAAGFLFTRNALEFQRRAGGRHLAGELRRQLRELLTPVRDLAAPRADRSRRQAWAVVCGKLAGFAAFAARRFGPPPRRLPGLGDVSVSGARTRT